jgi:NAD(P)-dependent dehydrogenase (short-subunit alcohol dehydrogenase family)
MSVKPVAIVTGGARGVGLAVAQQLAEGGYFTVILDNGTAVDGVGSDQGPLLGAVSDLTKLGLAAEGLFCDIADAGAVASATAEIVRRHGRVDVVANVAGILRPGPFLDDTEETWRSVVSTHVGGHLNVVQALLPIMLEQQSGHIVNFTSTSGLLGSRRQPCYSAAKEAIVGLTRYLASQLRSQGISVNAIAPVAKTRMSFGRKMTPSIGDSLSPMFTEWDSLHVGRFVKWLVSDTDRVTGRIFVVGGHYVTEYEHIRGWKWTALGTSSDSKDVHERMRWSIGRPAPSLIGIWPTRDFELLEVERPFEGTKSDPDLTAQGRPVVTSESSAIGPVVVGAESERGRRFTKNLGVSMSMTREKMVNGEVCELDGVANGVVAVLPDPKRSPNASTRGNDTIVSQAMSSIFRVGSDDVCAAIVETLRYVQFGIRATIHDEAFGVAVVMPGGLPWLDPAAQLREWMLWYAAVGAVRGGAATEAIYGVRVNGITLPDDQEAQADPVLSYALSADSSWLNGYQLFIDDVGVGVLSDEKPRLQLFSGDLDASVPSGFFAQLGV